MALQTANTCTEKLEKHEAYSIGNISMAFKAPSLSEMLSVNTFYSHCLYWECELGVNPVMSFLQNHNKCNKNKLQMIQLWEKQSFRHKMIHCIESLKTLVTPAGQNGAYAMQSVIKTSFTKQLLIV